MTVVDRVRGLSARVGIDDDEPLEAEPSVVAFAIFRRLSTVETSWFDRDGAMRRIFEWNSSMSW